MDYESLPRITSGILHLLLSASDAGFENLPEPSVALAIPHFTRIPVTAASQVGVIARPVSDNAN
jgi:hypothetical protein